MVGQEVGVCGWSIDREDAIVGIEYARDRLDIGVVQIGFFSDESLAAADVSAILKSARYCDASIIYPFAAFPREDYASIARINETGGLARDDEYEHRCAYLKRVAEIAGSLGCDGVASHICTVPTDETSPLYEKLLKRVKKAADELWTRNLKLLMETGRESGKALRQFIEQTGRENIRVNFDPGNFVVFGSDDPVKAAKALKGLIDNVHVKDAKASASPGVEFGSPAALGKGDARIDEVLGRLRRDGYAGPLLIEENTRALGIESLAEARDGIFDYFA